MIRFYDKLDNGMDDYGIVCQADSRYRYAPDSDHFYQNRIQKSFNNSMYNEIWYNEVSHTVECILNCLKKYNKVKYNYEKYYNIKNFIDSPASFSYFIWRHCRLIRDSLGTLRLCIVCGSSDEHDESIYTEPLDTLIGHIISTIFKNVNIDDIGNIDDSDNIYIIQTFAEYIYNSKFDELYNIHSIDEIRLKYESNPINPIMNTYTTPWLDITNVYTRISSELFQFNIFNVDDMDII